MTANVTTTEFAEKYGPEYGFLTVADMAAMLGISERTVYRLVKSGDIPKPRQISASISRWWLPDVKKWIGKQACPTR